MENATLHKPSTWASSRRCPHVQGRALGRCQVAAPALPSLFQPHNATSLRKMQMAEIKAVQEQAVLHGFCINRSGSRPPAAQRGRVPVCCSVARRSGSARHGTGRREQAGLWQHMALGGCVASCSSHSLEVFAEVAPPRLPSPRWFQTYPEDLSMVQPRHQHQAFGSKELRRLNRR